MRGHSAHISQEVVIYYRWHALYGRVEPLAIEAALLAERRIMEHQAERRRILELELQQARYEASLAERRYAACDPDNRLIAATLEKNWEATPPCQ